MSTDNIIIGNATRGLSLKVPVTIDPSARARHTYIIGQTGTGKSALLLNMGAQLAAAGGGFAFLDPHGQNASALVSHIPATRAHELVYIDLSDLDQSVGLNFIGQVPADDRPTVAGNIVAAFVHIFGKDAVGDRSQEVLRNSLMALMETSDGTLLSVMRLLRNADYRANVVAKVKDPLVRSYWEVFESLDDRFREQVIAPISNKLDACLSHYGVRNILSQPTSSVNLRKMMDERRILICNLSKGSIGEQASRFLGALLVSALTSAAFSREDTDEDSRVPFDLIVDEFHSFITAEFATILSEARKYRLYLTLANQYLDQFPDHIRAAIFGNAGTYIAFRSGADDALELAKQFGLADRRAFLDLSNFTARVRPLEEGDPGTPIYLETYPPPVPLHDRAPQLIQNSNVRFARARKKIEDHVKQLFSR